jgi:hypothetical protein
LHHYNCDRIRKHKHRNTQCLTTKFSQLCLRLWFLLLQSFLCGLAASGALTSGLRLITKAAFDNSKNGLRKGASKFQLLCDHVVIFVCCYWNRHNYDHFSHSLYYLVSDDNYILLLQFYSFLYQHSLSFYVFFSMHLFFLKYQLWSTTVQ